PVEETRAGLARVEPVGEVPVEIWTPLRSAQVERRSQRGDHRRRGVERRLMHVPLTPALDRVGGWRTLAVVPVVAVVSPWRVRRQRSAALQHRLKIPEPRRGGRVDLLVRELVGDEQATGPDQGTDLRDAGLERSDV